MSATQTLSASFGGVPFISPGFQPPRLLAAVAAVRRERMRELDGDPRNAQLSVRDFLRPDIALTVRALEGYSADIQFSELDRRRLSDIAAAKAGVCASFPQWERLIGLPVRYSLLLREDVIGCSCYAYPQHVFLAAAAFINQAELQEQLIHETCHNWMYMVEELWPFQNELTSDRYVLPSGTSNRNVTEVIGAAHVVATLGHWYSAQPASALARRRVRELSEYLKGCLAILDALPSDRLSHVGIEIREVLRTVALGEASVSAD